MPVEQVQALARVSRLVAFQKDQGEQGHLRGSALVQERFSKVGFSQLLVGQQQQLPNFLPAS